jgi:plastocyanin
VSRVGLMCVVRWIGAFACLAVLGCEIETKTSLEEVGEAGTDLHSEIAAVAQVVQLTGGRDVEHVVPPHLEIELGEWVQFVSLDRRVHTVSFVPDSLSPEALVYLADTDQLDGPPLLMRGSRFLVDFRDAPSGRYVFSSTSHGDPVFGSITVGEISADP